jgi:putative ABC transport system permease protein
MSGVSREPGTQKEVVTNVERIALGYSSLPGSFITPDALRRRGLETARVGWLIEANEPLTNEQLAAAREVAADAGLTIESRDHQEGLLALRTSATAAGMLVAFAVLAMTVGLIRSATAGDLRTLTATGATSGIRRTLTAATAGALALLGALLGTTGAYLALIAGVAGDIGALSPIPVLHHLLIVAGIPLIAVIAGWLLAGREPPTLARQPLE